MSRTSRTAPPSGPPKQQTPISFGGRLVPPPSASISYTPYPQQQQPFPYQSKPQQQQQNHQSEPVAHQSQGQGVVIANPNGKYTVNMQGAISLIESRLSAIEVDVSTLKSPADSSEPEFLNEMREQIDFMTNDTREQLSVLANEISGVKDMVLNLQNYVTNVSNTLLEIQGKLNSGSS